jgi:hypothetical protein
MHDKTVLPTVTKAGFLLQVEGGQQKDPGRNHAYKLSFGRKVRLASFGAGLWLGAGQGATGRGNHRYKGSVVRKSFDSPRIQGLCRVQATKFVREVAQEKAIAASNAKGR